MVLSLSFSLARLYVLQNKDHWHGVTHAVAGEGYMHGLMNVSKKVHEKLERVHLAATRAAAADARQPVAKSTHLLGGCSDE
jgi:hypothetical protein